MSCLLVFATRGMRKYAADVVKSLRNMGVDTEDAVDKLAIDEFANGEMEVALDLSVRGKTVVLFASCARNEADIDVNSSKIELYHAVDAMKRAQAAKVIVFEPCISCSRSDRTTRRSSVGLWVHFKTLVALGCKHIITYQLHSDKSKSMLDPNRCIIDDIPAMPLLEQYLCDQYIKTKDALESEVRQKWVFCSVDAGGEKMARRYADMFGSPLVIAHKQRDYSRVNTVQGINILSAEPIEGKNVWIVDDMIDTGGSVESLVRALPALKPNEVNIIAAHAVFSGKAPEKMNALKKANLISRLVVTDTCFCPPDKTQFIPFLETVSSAMLSAKILRNIVTNTSMGALLTPFTAEQYLSRPNLFSGN